MKSLEARKDEVLRKPQWLRIKIPNNGGNRRVEKLMDDLSLNTVCREANCPNRAECYSKGTATFMILGRNCTRGCRFCNVRSAEPQCVDEREPARVARAVKEMGLRYVVVTSVTRDDLPDGGASQFRRTIEEIKKINRDVAVEVLIPDFQGSLNSLVDVLEPLPEILNHNIETVPRLYEEVRPEADYERSLELIRRAKEIDGRVKTKSGIMLGLGETREEVVEVFRDLRRNGCDFLTLGQYLAPSKEHLPVREYVTPEDFNWYREKALELGFEGVASDPLVRSSYKAWELYEGGR
ncbi:lipoyl synthase [Propionigenium maris DSM 9537]|uniref:Lipoyl synthase n=1 Tax=Propionigenium maris DSM 9537 TaxID=1123000 RepID=A0A9W6LPR7_9FUSO|nr:lipoyl synthase [Propionigenium maris]GLI57887.1 lipoyl synthase [Propionigenium maris DSM 9537]